MPLALLTRQKILFKLSWPIAALFAAVAVAGCGAEYARARPAPATVQSYLGAANEAPGTFSRLDTAQIRYSQSSYSLYGEIEEGELYKVEENVQWLKDHSDQDLPWGGPIRVFRKQAFMDDWGSLSQGNFAGDPKNLDTGEIYTLDHRRLVAYRMAARKSIPVQWTSPTVVRDNRWKFTTTNGGRSIAPSP